MDGFYLKGGKNTGLGRVELKAGQSAYEKDCWMLRWAQAPQALPKIVRRFNAGKAGENEKASRRDA